MRHFAGLLIGLALAAPAAAQDAPGVAVRPFVMATDQSFVAVDAFNATFGKSMFPFFGGGVQVVVNDRFFVEFGASRWRQAGSRAYLYGGKAFNLGIPLTATLTPLELTAGYRVHLRHLPRVRPYVAAGVGSYGYTETASFSNPGDDVDTRKTGVLVNGGVEFRLQSVLAVAADVQYSHVPGILGQAGVSQQAGESDLGGVAARLKIVIGR